MYVVADIGGTKTRIAESRDLKKLGTPVVIDTPRTYEDALPYIASIIRRIAAGEIIEGAAVGKSRVLWTEKDFAHKLGKLINSPVTIENDTALCGLGEAHFGAGKGSKIFVYVTVSTGVNGVRIVGGSIDVSAQGFETGGQYLSTEGTTSLEELISGNAIQKHYGVHPRDLGKDHPVWEEEARILAYGLHNTILHWSPDRVALGGSMMNEIGIPVERVRFHLESIMRKFPTVPDIVHSELKDMGGLWGGIARLRQLNSSS